MVMRYTEYQKKLARLDKDIADCLARENRAAEGRPWYFRMMPSLAARVIEESTARREALAEKRLKLERKVFGADALMWNADPAAVFRRTVPGSDDSVAMLRAAADAAFDLKK
jgi:hypothetical protein